VTVEHNTPVIILFTDVWKVR